MKITYCFIVILLLFTSVVSAQKEKLVGNWLITQIKTPEKIREVYAGRIYEVDYVNENTLYALIGFTDNDAMHTIKLIKIK